jgi:hypothetical protein
MKKFGIGFIPFQHAAKTLLAKANAGARELNSTTEQTILSKARRHVLGGGGCSGGACQSSIRLHPRLPVLDTGRRWKMTETGL